MESDFAIENSQFRISFDILRRMFALECFPMAEESLAYMAFLKSLWNRDRPKAKKILAGKERSLYETPEGLQFWLDERRYIDQCIIHSGQFEPVSTEFVKRFLKPGSVALDVGANIGYYSVVFSKLVGEQGKVLAFEPTVHYGNVLSENLKQGQIKNCEIFSYGLSDRRQELEISIGSASATLHWSDDIRPIAFEKIHLQRLDDVWDSFGLDRLDFIKIDVDGHEPAFLNGAWETIAQYRPVILLEVSHANYLDYGITAWDFYDLLKAKGLHIFSEKTLLEYPTKRQFLMECGNFAYSANVVLSYDHHIEVQPLGRGARL